MKRIESIKVTAAALSMVLALTACATKGSEDNGTAEGTQEVATRETDVIVDVAQTTDPDTQTTEDTTGTESGNAILTESGIILELEGGFTGYEYYRSKQDSPEPTTYIARDYYSADGNLIYRELYSGGEYQAYRYYQFDDQGRLIREDYHNEYTDVPDTAVEYEYGEFGLIHKTESYQPSGIISNELVYEYDSQGRHTVTLEYGSEGNQMGHFDYEYMEDGSYKEIYHYEALDYEYSFYRIYDADGNLIDEYHPDFDDFASTKSKEYIYEYDEAGRVIKYDFYEAEKYKASNYYEYDAEGRIIHKYYQRGEQISQESTFEYEAL